MGFILGMMISLVICVCSSSVEEIMEDKLGLFVQLIGFGIYGSISVGSSIVYGIDSWSLRKVTCTHYVITFTAFFIANGLLGWFNDGIILLIVFIMMTIMYLIIWLIEYTIWKRTIKEMNEELQMFISEEEDNL